MCIFVNMGTTGFSVSHEKANRLPLGAGLGKSQDRFFNPGILLKEAMEPFMFWTLTITEFKPSCGILSQKYQVNKPERISAGHDRYE